MLKMYCSCIYNMKSDYRYLGGKLRRGQGEGGGGGEPLIGQIVGQSVKHSVATGHGGGWRPPWRARRVFKFLGNIVPERYTRCVRYIVLHCVALQKASFGLYCVTKRIILCCVVLQKSIILHCVVLQKASFVLYCVTRCASGGKGRRRCPIHIII